MEPIVTSEPPSQPASVDDADDRTPHKRMPFEGGFRSDNLPPGLRRGYRDKKPRQQQYDRRDTRRHTNPPPISDSVDTTGKPTSPDNENKDHHGSPSDSRLPRDGFPDDTSSRGGDHRDRGSPPDFRPSRDGHRSGGFRGDGPPRYHDQRDNGRGLCSPNMTATEIVGTNALPKDDPARCAGVPATPKHGESGHHCDISSAPSESPRPPQPLPVSTKVQPTSRDMRSFTLDGRFPPLNWFLGPPQSAPKGAWATPLLQSRPGLASPAYNYPLSPESNKSTKKYATRPDRDEPLGWGPISGVPASRRLAPKPSPPISAKPPTNQYPYAGFPPTLNNQCNPAAGGHSHPPPQSGAINPTAKSFPSEGGDEVCASTPSTPKPPAPLQGAPLQPPRITQGVPINAVAQLSLPDEPKPAPGDHVYFSQTFSSIGPAEQPVTQPVTEGRSNSHSGGSSSIPLPPGPARGVPSNDRTNSRPHDQRDTAHNSQPRPMDAGGENHSNHSHSKSYAELQDEVFRLRSKVQRMEKRAAEELVQFNEQFRANSDTNTGLKVKLQQDTELRDEVVYLRSRVQRMEKQATEELARFNKQLRAKADTIAGLKDQKEALLQAVEKSAMDELTRFHAALLTKDALVSELKEQRVELQKITEKSAAELMRLNAVLRTKDDIIADLKEQKIALQQKMEKAAAEELVDFNAALRAKDNLITDLKEQQAALQQDKENPVTEELVRFNAWLRIEDDIIAEQKEPEAPLRQVRSWAHNDSRLASNVKGLVEALNYEIQQTAIDAAQFLGEKVHRSIQATFNEDRSSAVELVEKIVGGRLCQELEACDHKLDFTSLQLALQATLCQSCKRFVELWDDGVFTGLSDYLADIYRTMRSAEPQLVLAQWRALTQLQVNAILDREHSEPMFIPSVIEDILQMAVVSKIHHPDLRSLLTSVLSEKLQNIERRMRYIKRAVTLELISGDFELIVVNPERTFDGTFMTDIFGPSKGAGGRVACTTELGLKLTKKVVKGEETIHETLNLLAAQVLLESSIADLLL